MDVDLIDEYLSKSDRELFQQLGAVLLGQGPGFGPTDGTRFGKFGKKWFNDKLEVYRGKLCGHPAVQALIESPESNRAIQVSALVDILSSIENESSHTLLVAVLITKLGLDSLCRDRAK